MVDTSFPKGRRPHLFTTQISLALIRRIIREKCEFFYEKKIAFLHNIDVKWISLPTGIFKKLEKGDCISHVPALHSSPSTGQGILRGQFIKNNWIQSDTMPFSTKIRHQCFKVYFFRYRNAGNLSLFLDFLNLPWKYWKACQS